MNERFLNDRVQLFCGDCRDVLATLPENSLDACVTDPPYHLTSIVQRFGKPAGNSTEGYGSGFDVTASGTGGAMARLSRGFMGKVWDGGDIAFRPETWAAVYRVLKPGAHLIAMGGTRTYHRLAYAIEDAGFEIRDTVSYLYGSGFPKSHSVSKGLGDAICSCEALSERDMRSVQQTDVSTAVNVADERQQVLLASVPQQGSSTAGWSQFPDHDRREQSGMEGRCDISASARQLRERPIRAMPAGFDFDGKNGRLCNGASLDDGADDRTTIATDGMRASSRPSTVEQHSEQSGTVAVQSEPQERGAWPHCGSCGKPIVPDGLGTALKPACELIVLARKPLSEGTVAANVLRWGTGAINVDGCRVEGDEIVTTHSRGTTKEFFDPNQNRNIPQNRSEFVGNARNGRWPANVVHDGSDEVVAAFPETQSGNLNGTMCGQGTAVGEWGKKAQASYWNGDSGSAARFFYTAKADADDRLGSKHPTVKPLELMQWLVRLVTPPRGMVLDPFAGTGTTGEAVWREGMCAVLIEAEPEYQADIRRRMALVLAGPDERQRESIKARNLPRDDGPLFAPQQAQSAQPESWAEMWAKPFDFSQEPKA